MTTEDQFLTPQQSLDIIGKMIAQAQGKVQRSSFHFLLWGWVITLANFGMYFILTFTTYPQYAPLVWLITIPAWIISFFYGRKLSRESIPLTHLDRVNMWLWICTGVIIIPVVVFGSKINYQINPIILTMIALPTFLTGIMLRFKPLLVGGVSFLISGTLCFLIGAQDQYLVGGVAMILGYLIPGYMLKSQKV
jgi:hypothetical protein